MKKKIDQHLRLEKEKKDFWAEEFGGSTLETGLIWALVIIMFLLLVGWVMDLYGWIEEKLDSFETTINTLSIHFQTIQIRKLKQRLPFFEKTTNFPIF